MGLSDVAYLANAIIKAKKEGQDIGDYEQVLKEYGRLSKANAYMIIGAIEFVKSSYGPNWLGSENLGHVLAGARNLGIDLIQASDLMKYNLMNFAAGNVNHPSKYEWTSEA